MEKGRVRGTSFWRRAEEGREGRGREEGEGSLLVALRVSAPPLVSQPALYALLAIDHWHPTSLSRIPLLPRKSRARAPPPLSFSARRGARQA
jgi:hypothetical protein